MSLQIYVAHTGERLQADPVSFASIDALRSWVARKTSIAPQRQIFLTARGKSPKAQTLITENEIFVYDRQYTSEGGEADVHQTRLPDPFKPENPPDTLANQNDLQAWRNLFLARRTWALGIADYCLPIRESVQQLEDERDIIHRSATAAVENLKITIGSLEHKFEEAQNWANETLNDQRAALDGWKQCLNRMKQVQLKKDFSFLLHRPSTPKKSTKVTGTLQDLVDLDEVMAAGAEGSLLNNTLTKQLQSAQVSLQGAVSDTQALVDDVQAAMSPSEDVVGLLEELETIARKISSDGEYVLGQPNNQKTLSTVSRMALHHTRDLLPTLREIGLEMHTAWVQAIQQRNDAVSTAIRHMKTIALIQSDIPNVKNKLVAMEEYDPGEVFHVIDSVFQLPKLYGSLLIEGVRRQEWNDKMKADSAALAEEMAIFKEEEQRRRKKWARNMGDFILTAADETNTLNIEVDVKGSGDRWPEVTRDDVNSFVEDLKSQSSMSEVVHELTRLIKELDAPTRQQRRRSKAFKQGSMYDAELGRSSLLLRGDDMVKSLKDDKSRLEEKLRGTESRVRKLEDLLHRSTQIPRQASGTLTHEGGVMQIPSSPSPRPDFPSRRSSVSSRRLSSNQTLEEKALVQRIVSLEADLVSERDVISRLQKEAHTERRNSSEHKDKMLEAETTKKDLLENVKAQQREFDAERRSLEGEIEKHKQRLEEVEDEIDRMLGSRDNEKLGSDERIRELLAELEKVREESAEEAEKISTNTEALRKDYTVQIEKVESLERQLHQRNNLQAELQTKVDEAQQLNESWQRSQADFVGSLQAAHLHLSPEGSAPEDIGKLIKAVEMLSEGLAIHSRGADKDLDLLQADHRDLQERLTTKQEDVERLKDQLSARESDLASARESLKEEQSRYTSLKSDLEDEQAQLKMLRGKFAAGETGSEALKDRVAEEESRVAELSEKLAVAETRATASDEELVALKQKVEDLTTAERASLARLEERGLRAKDLSQRLYTQTDRMGRMLDQLGLMVTRQDDSMIIQRAPKTSSSMVQSNTGNGDAMVKSTSGITTLLPNANIDLLYWLQESPELETEKYDRFISSLDLFSLEVFGEAVVKRVKEKDLLARKWHREAQNYREKSHRSQAEAHDKIAYRSFKEGDIALFLPTRNQSIRSWAAFNVGAPHYFLREQDVHKLHTRDWLLARITKIDERVVDLSRSMQANSFSNAADRRSLGEVSDGASSNIEDDNPFDLSDGLRWYLVDAAEEKPGAPSTPGLGKSTVASANVDAQGSVRATIGKRTANGSGGGLSVASKTLSKSLDVRRASSSSSKKGGVSGLISGLQERHGRTSSVASSVISASQGPTVGPAAGNGTGVSGTAAITAGSSNRTESPAATAARASEHTTADIEVQPSPPPEAEAAPTTDSTDMPPPKVPERRSASASRSEAPVFEQGQSDHQPLIRQESNLSTAGTPFASPARNAAAATTVSPRRPSSQSPTKQRSRSKGWEKLWSLDYSTGG